MSIKYDKITRRLAIILTKFNSGDKIKVEILAEEFNVSVRTIQRDINSRLSYLPIKKENGYYSLEEFYLGKFTLDDINTFAIMSGVSELYPSLNENIIPKILDNTINSAYLIKGFTYEKETTQKSDIFQLLEEVILKHTQIQYQYNKKDRVINPYKLVNTSGIWYLVGDEKGILKTYTVNKIINLVSTHIKFTPIDEFLDIIKKNRANWFSQTTIEVILEIDSKVAEYFLRRNLFPNQKIIKHNNNNLILSTKASYDNEILGVVQYWIPMIKIISPLYLNRKLKEILQNYINL